MADEKTARDPGGDDAVEAHVLERPAENLVEALEEPEVEAHLLERPTESRLVE